LHQSVHVTVDVITVGGGVSTKSLEQLQNRYYQYFLNYNSEHIDLH
jgi:hypothetical protein